MKKMAELKEDNQMPPVSIEKITNMRGKYDPQPHLHLLHSLVIIQLDLVDATKLARSLNEVFALALVHSRIFVIPAVGYTNVLE